MSLQQQGYSYFMIIYAVRTLCTWYGILQKGLAISMPDFGVWVSMEEDK
jgi:hypothetical protein